MAVTARLSFPWLVLGAALVLAGCAGLPFQRDDAPDPAAEPEPPVSVTLAPDDDVMRPEQRPGTRAEPRSDAPRERDEAPGGLLGETLAGLGSPSEGGMWLRTGLVEAAQPGRVETERGDTVSVELRPSGREPGSGSHLSLEALQALDLSPARLATLRVFAGE